MPKRAVHAGRTPASSRDDYVTNKILIVFTLAFLSMLALMILQRYIGHPEYQGSVVLALYSLAACGGAAFLFFSVRTVIVYTQGKKLRGGFFNSLSGAALSLIFGAACLLSAAAGYEGVQLLFIALPVFAVLYLVFYIYQREFFFIALFIAYGAAALWLLRAMFLNRFVYNRYLLAAEIAAIAFVLLAAAFFNLLCRREGVLRLGKGRDVRVLPAGTKYGPLLLTCALVIAALVSVFFFASVYIVYTIFALFGLLFLLAVYYTVKLM